MSTTTPKAEAVLVGVRKVDPAKYDGWDGTEGCWGCEQDVDKIAKILLPLEYQVHVLKTENATRRNVMQALTRCSRMEHGDIFVFYYSGHGGQQCDQNGSEQDELDGQDETLLLYDGELRDDSLNEVWVKVNPGVRVVMVSDSCNSGTNFKAPGRQSNTQTPIVPIDAKAARQMKGQLIHLGGCRDSKIAAGFSTGGLFTTALCNVWQDGKFQGNYKSLHQAIRRLVAAEQPGQQPVYSEYGPVSLSFRRQRPFEV